MSLTSPSSPSGSEAEAAPVGAVQPLPLGRLVVALAVLATLFAMGAIAALLVSWNLSAADRAELDALGRLDCVVIQTGVKTTFVPTPAAAGAQPAALAPGMQAGDWEYEPQILVRYELDGESVEQWVSIAEPFQALDHWRAQEMAGHYRIGDKLTVWHSAGDPSDLFLKPGHGGRQTLIGGRIIAGLLALPAFGLVLAAILLWQAARRQPTEAPPAATPLATRLLQATSSAAEPPTAVRESADS